MAEIGDHPGPKEPDTGNAGVGEAQQDGSLCCYHPEKIMEADTVAGVQLFLHIGG